MCDPSLTYCTISYHLFNIVIAIPVITPLDETNTITQQDRLEGTIIVSAVESLNFEVRVRVNSDPCPSTVFWSFEGSNIIGGDMYTFNDPCSVPGSFSPYIFTLTIANPNITTSGRYSAIFSNLGGSVNLPGLLISIPSKTKTIFMIIYMPHDFLVPVTSFPVDKEIFGLLIDYESGPNPSCLLNNGVARLTCDSTGVPRPNIRFLRSNTPILPGEEGFERFTQIFPDQVWYSHCKD